VGREIFGKSLKTKLVVAVLGIIIASVCYAKGPGFGPVIEALQNGFAGVVAQAKTAAENTLGKLTGLEKLNSDSLYETNRIANLSQTLGATIGVPLQAPNAEQLKSAALGWMRDFATDPIYTLSSATALEVPIQRVNFGEAAPVENVGVNYVTTHRQVENKLIAHNSTPAEERRLAALREYMIENATVSGVALATTNKQTLNKTRNKIKKITDDAADSRNLREDVKVTNAYLMVVALELANLRELQAQQLELMAAFSRTFVSPMAHMEAKQNFRQQRGAH